MLINEKSKNQIMVEIMQYLKSRFPEADLVPGTVLRDLLVEAPATYFYDTYKIVAFLEQVLDLGKLTLLLENADERAKMAGIFNISISEMESMMTAIVELWASNFGISRKQGTKATGIVSFYPKSGITIPANGITIPANTRIMVPGTSVIFKTLQEVILKKDNSLFNASSQNYEVGVLAESEIIGTQGNVPANTITELYPGQNLDVAVINYYNFSGGYNPETDLELLERVKLTYTGNFHGTANSILARILSNPNVQDAVVAYLPEDKNKVSPGISDIDAFIKSENFVQATYTNYINSNYIKLPNKYVSNIISVENNSGIVSPTLYKLQTNYLGESFVIFNQNIGDLATVKYMYNTVLQEVENTLNDPAYIFLGQSIHVFQAESVPIYVAAVVQIDTSYGLTDKAKECEVAISSYLSGLRLGSLINTTQIINILLSVDGVLDVKLPLTRLSIYPDGAVSDIQLENKQFATTGQISITTQYEEIKNYAG